MKTIQGQRKKYDSLLLGTVVGIISPGLALFGFYFIRYSHISFGKFFNDILLAYHILTPVVSLCVLINLLLFFIFIWTNRNHTARGILLATILYAGFVVYQKYIT